MGVRGNGKAGKETRGSLAHQTAPRMRGKGTPHGETASTETEAEMQKKQKEKSYGC